MEKELTFKIGGEAGQGLVTIGDILAKLFARGGWHVFTSQDYESRIRGGHNIFQIRISQDTITAMVGARGRSISGFNPLEMWKEQKEEEE